MRPAPPHEHRCFSSRTAQCTPISSARKTITPARRGVANMTPHGRLSSPVPPVLPVRQKSSDESRIGKTGALPLPSWRSGESALLLWAGSVSARPRERSASRARPRIRPCSLGIQSRRIGVGERRPRLRRQDDQLAGGRRKRSGEVCSGVAGFPRRSSSRAATRSGSGTDTVQS